MASYSDIKKKLASLEEDSLYSIAEIICDLEEELEEVRDELADVTKERDELATQVGEEA